MIGTSADGSSKMYLKVLEFETCIDRMDSLAWILHDGVARGVISIGNVDTESTSYSFHLVTDGSTWLLRRSGALVETPFIGNSSLQNQASSILIIVSYKLPFSSMNPHLLI